MSANYNDYPISEIVPPEAEPEAEKPRVHPADTWSLYPDYVPNGPAPQLRPAQPLQPWFPGPGYEGLNGLPRATPEELKFMGHYPETLVTRPDINGPSQFRASQYAPTFYRIDGAVPPPPIPRPFIPGDSDQWSNSQGQKRPLNRSFVTSKTRRKNVQQFLQVCTSSSPKIQNIGNIIMQTCHPPSETRDTRTSLPFLQSLGLTATAAAVA